MLVFLLLFTSQNQFKTIKRLAINKS